MKRICLINPPSPFLMDQKVFVSLGILRVAASLEVNGFDVRVLDLAGIDNWESYIDSVVVDYDVIGISSTTPQIPIVTEIGEYIKDNYNITLILGGPHATMINSAYKVECKKNISSRATVEIKRLENIFDKIVCGDGEFAILDAIKETCKLKILDSEEEEKWFLTNDRYNKLSFPARHLISMADYHYEIDGANATNLISQMGCPFGCGFCGGRNTKTFRNIRTRSVQSVMAEIDHLYHNYGYTGFMAYDDELNVNVKGFVDFLDALIEYQINNNVKFNLRGFTRSDLLTSEQADKMYKAGFKWLLTGFESGSDRMLINMNKRNTVEDNTRACRIAKDAGLKVKALMSIGHPGESFKTISETSEWVDFVKPDEVDITIISTYPGTPYYDESVWVENKDAWKYVSPKTNDILYSLNVDYMKDSVFYKSDPNNYKSFVFTENLSCQDLVDARKKLELLLKGE